jgi:hypothetical protein
MKPVHWWLKTVKTAVTLDISIVFGLNFEELESQHYLISCLIQKVHEKSDRIRYLGSYNKKSKHFISPLKFQHQKYMKIAAKRYFQYF